MLRPNCRDDKLCRHQERTQHAQNSGKNLEVSKKRRIFAPLNPKQIHYGKKKQEGRHNLIWRKSSPTFSLGRLDYEYQHEPIMYTWTKSHHNYRKGKYRSTIWDFDKPRHCDLHPTMKPVELVANALLDCTKEADVVIDAFGGSGTTLIACEQLGRKARLMELDPHYCDVIIARWEKLTGMKAEKLTN